MNLCYLNNYVSLARAGHRKFCPKTYLCRTISKVKHNIQTQLLLRYLCTQLNIVPLGIMSTNSLVYLNTLVNINLGKVDYMPTRNCCYSRVYWKYLLV